ISNAVESKIIGDKLAKIEDKGNDNGLDSNEVERLTDVNANGIVNMSTKNAGKYDRDKYLKPSSTESKMLRKQNPKSFKILQVMRDWIVRDFLEYWYKPFVTSVEEEFLARVKLALDGVFHILIKRVCHVNWNHYLMHRLLLPFEDFLLKI
ncbi:hypothetical protein RFI_23632, partial [Reticulomyxa filosa]